MKKIFFYIIIATISLGLFGCNNTTTEETHYKDTTESIADSGVAENSTEALSSEKEQPTEKDYSIPEEFVDYKKFIEEDISVLNIDTSSWNTDDYTHNLWRGSFYGHSGMITVRLGWDNKTIIEFFLQLDDTDKLSESDRENLNDTLQDTFGSTVEENNISYSYSGKGEYEFQFPKLLAQTSVCTISWNTDNMIAYMNSKPKAAEKQQETTPIIEKKAPAIGMTADEVRQSTWGEPSSINKTTTKYSVREQWVYKSPSKNRYIYIEDELVTAIQE